MTETMHLEKRFFGQMDTIRQRAREDAAFKELCEDYQAAVTAMAHWQLPANRSDQRVEEYRLLVTELEAEIEMALKT